MVANVLNLHCKRDRTQIMLLISLSTKTMGTCLQQVYAERGCCLEELPRVMDDDRDGWSESRKPVLAALLDDDNEFVDPCFYLIFYNFVRYTHTHTYIYIYIYIVCVYIYQPRAGCDTRSIFKRSRAGLNSEFSFSLTSCLIMVKYSLLCYLPITWGVENR